MASRSEAVLFDTAMAADARGNVVERAACRGAGRMNPRTDAAGIAHVNQRAAAEAPYALEAHAPGTRPSRKSTRGSANHLKPDHALTIRETIEMNSPQARHDIGDAHAGGNTVRARRG